MRIQTDSRTDSIIYWATSAERARKDREMCMSRARLAHDALSARSWVVIARQANSRVVLSLQTLRKHAEGSR